MFLNRSYRKSPAPHRRSSCVKSASELLGGTTQETVIGAERLSFWAGSGPVKCRLPLWARIGAARLVSAATRVVRRIMTVVIVQLTLLQVRLGRRNVEMTPEEDFI